MEKYDSWQNNAFSLLLKKLQNSMTVLTYFFKKGFYNLSENSDLMVSQHNLTNFLINIQNSDFAIFLRFFIKLVETPYMICCTFIRFLTIICLLIKILHFLLVTQSLSRNLPFLTCVLPTLGTMLWIIDEKLTKLMLSRAKERKIHEDRKLIFQHSIIHKWVPCFLLV